MAEVWGATSGRGDVIPGATGGENLVSLISDSVHWSLILRRVGLEIALFLLIFTPRSKPAGSV